MQKNKIRDRKIEHDERYAFALGGGYKYENGAYHLDASGSFAQLSASDGIISSYTAELISATDYYAFGAPLPGRTWQGGEYRFGFNGKEKDDETYGTGNAYDFGARIYDSRLGRWYRVDPLANAYSGLSVYSSSLNNPLNAIDVDGRLVIYINGEVGSFGGKFSSNSANNTQRGDISYWGGASFTNQVQRSFGERLSNTKFVDGDLSTSATLRFERGKARAVADFQNIINSL